MKKRYRESLALAAMTLVMMAGSLIAAEAEMDKRIESAAKESYVFKTYFKGDDIHVRSQDGVVTLAGTVSEESHLSLAADTVADLPGVKSVDNRLEVKGGTPEKNSDAWIHTKIKMMLKLHRNLDAANTEVEVKEGRVTLRGEAGTQAEKELTTENVRDVEGVKDVDNMMTVEGCPGKRSSHIHGYEDKGPIRSYRSPGFQNHKSHP